MVRIGYDIHDQTRQQMIAETSRFIEWGLKHPDMVVRIPAKAVTDDGTSVWPAVIGRYFWSTILASRDIRNAGVGLFRRLSSKLLG